MARSAEWSGLIISAIFVGKAIRLVFDLLQRPYALHEAHKPWRRAVLVGGFVFLLLFLFQPFGLDQLSLGTAFFDAISYGLISAACVYSLGRLLPRSFPTYYQEDTWTVGKEIASNLTYILFIAIGNYAYSVVKGYTQFDWGGFLFMLLATVTVATVVVFIVVLIRSNQALRHNLRAARSMTDHLPAHRPHAVVADLPPVTLPAEVDSQQIAVAPDRMIVLASDANYVVCTYYDENGAATEHRFRSTLKAVEELLAPYSFLFRCHRAFIVNLESIESVDGNAKGYSLTLKDYALPVPVARSKGKELTRALDAVP
jgi:DNA-binding LytR/AlgR family response regulator